MSFTLFAVFFVVFAAAMALWIDVRFPGLAPEAFRPALVRLVVAVVLAHLTVPVAAYLAQPLAHPGSAVVVLSTGFAAMTLLMLACLWMLKLAQGLLGGSLR